MYLSSNNKVIIYKSSFVKSSSNLGGLLYSRSLNYIYFVKSFSLDMSVSQDGGCFYCRKNGIVYIYNSTFDNSSAAEKGGLVYASESNKLRFI